MNTKTEYQDGILRLMLEDDQIHTEQIKEAYYQKEGDYLVKTFQGPFKQVEQIRNNFSRLVPSVFETVDSTNWMKALLFFAQFCKEHQILWFLTGSACDAVRGLHVIPHDLDIEIYSKDWKKAEECMGEYIVEPFIETKGWARDNFGRIVMEKMQVDLVADQRFDLPNHTYEPYEWNGYTLWLEPFWTRYKTEIERKREERVEAFEKYLAQQGIHN